MAKLAKKKASVKLAVVKEKKAEVKTEKIDSGPVLANLSVDFYKTGLAISIKDCSPQMLMAAIEEVAKNYILPNTEKK